MKFNNKSISKSIIYIKPMINSLNNYFSYYFKLTFIFYIFILYSILHHTSVNIFFN